MAATALLVVGCARPAVAPRPPTPITAPAPGASILYIFRPELDAVQRYALPQLSIDSKPVAKLPYASYTIVSLVPGRHAMSLTPGDDDLKTWKGTAEFVAEANQTYFVAVWNPNQPPHTDSVPIAFRGSLLFIPIIRGGSTAEPGVKFESVDRSTAEYGLAGLRLVPPENFKVPPPR